MVPSLCLLALAVYGVRCVFEVYITLFNFDETPYRIAGSNVFMVMSWIIALIASIIWLYKLWRSGKIAWVSFKFQKIVPVLTFCITAVAAVVINSVFHATTWPDVREESLVSYAFIQLVYTVFMTGGWVDEVVIQYNLELVCLITMSFIVLVLPGRIARIDAEMRMEDLTLKGIFVRFISHEIRYCILYCTMLYYGILFL